MPREIELGQEAVAGSYGLGRVTDLSNYPSYIGVTPYVAGYQMMFAAHNVELIPIPKGYRIGSPPDA